MCEVDLRVREDRLFLDFRIFLLLDSPHKYLVSLEKLAILVLLHQSQLKVLPNKN